MTAATAERPRLEAPPRAGVWAALARREAWFAVRHPLMLVGVAASCWVLWSLNRDLLPHHAAFSTYVGLGLAPLAGAGLLLGHLVASRAHRNDTLEIESTAPAVQRSRTMGLLAGTLVTVPVASAVVVAYSGYLHLRGATGAPVVGELLVGPMVVALATVAGVAVGTWFPNRFSGLLALGAVAVVQIGFQDAEGTRHWFAWWHTVLWHTAPDLWVRPTGGHLAYLAGIAVLVVGVAMLRHGMRPLPLVAVAAGVTLALGGGIVQARPPGDATVNELLAPVTDPQPHWVTIERPSVTYRVHPGYQRWVDRWDAAIQGVLPPILPSDRPALVVEQWHHPYLSQLEEELGYFSARGEEVQARGEAVAVGRVTGAATRPDTWPILVGDVSYPGQNTRLVIAAADRAVGLPLLPVETAGRLYTEEEIASFTATPDDLAAGGAVDADSGPWWPGKELGEPQPRLGDRIALSLACDAEGQAREVLAAWLAAGADPELADMYAAIRRHGTEGLGPYDEGTFEYAPEGASTMEIVNWSSLGWRRLGGYGDVSDAGGVIGSPTATDLAAQLLQLPQDEVAATVAAHWDEWTDPGAGTEALIDTFRLEAPPSPEQWLQRSGLDPDRFAASVAAYPHYPGDPEPAAGEPYPVCR